MHTYLFGKLSPLYTFRCHFAVPLQILNFACNCKPHKTILFLTIFFSKHFHTSTLWSLNRGMFIVPFFVCVCHYIIGCSLLWRRQKQKIAAAKYNSSQDRFHFSFFVTVAVGWHGTAPFVNINSFIITTWWWYLLYWMTFCILNKIIIHFYKMHGKIMTELMCLHLMCC